MKLATPLLFSLALTASLTASAQTPAQAPASTDSGKVSLIGRPAPNVDQLPNDEYGKLVRYGHELATRTFAVVGPEVKDKKMRYAGNNLSCASCHQESATKPYAMPWNGVTGNFPQYRPREDEVSTVEERINGCMERSMNGKPLPLNSREMKAFVTYIHFLSKGIPVGANVEGAGAFQSKPPNRRADPVAGQLAYKAQCAACHGDNGAGVRVGAKGDAQGYTFPPLWGADSFNTGAGMNRILTAMRFIKHNMPQGANHRNVVLNDDEAFDVAALLVSQPRPEKAHLERDFPARWNKPVDAAFPPYVDGAPADQHKYGPFPPLADMARKAAAKHAEEVKAQEAASAK